ncbi:MAG: hypothetical protein ACI3U8_00370 [Candidatus Onthomonas sp.]
MPKKQYLSENISGFGKAGKRRENNFDTARKKETAKDNRDKM